MLCVTSQCVQGDGAHVPTAGFGYRFSPQITPTGRQRENMGGWKPSVEMHRVYERVFVFECLQIDFRNTHTKKRNVQIRALNSNPVFNAAFGEKL